MEMKNTNLIAVLALVVGVGIGYFFIGTGADVKSVDQGASTLSSKTADTALNRDYVASKSINETGMNLESLGQGDFFAMVSEIEKNKIDEQTSNNLVQILTESVTNFAMQNNLALTPTGGSNKYFCYHMMAGVFWVSNTNWGNTSVGSGSVFCYSIGN